MAEFSAQHIGGGVVVYTSREHAFGTDALLLADFAGRKGRGLACDLGTGCGIIPLYWASKEALKAPRPKAAGKEPPAVWGLDIQPQAIEQFRKGIADSFSGADPACGGIPLRLVPLWGDLRNLPEDLPRGRFDLVTCNPPYQNGAGIRPASPAGEIARHEVLCTVQDVCRTADLLLKFGGRLCVCQKPERLADVLCAMRENHIEPKVLRFVAKETGGAPWLFLLEGRKGARPNMRVPAPLAVYENGAYSAEMRRIYGPAFG